MPVAWTFVFAALVIGLLATKGMYRPALDLWKLDAIRSIVSAVAIAAALTIALRAVFTDASAIAEETLEPWLLSTAFLIANRVWLISSERRARRKGEAGQRALIVGAGNVGRLVAKRLLERPEVGLTPIGFLDKEPLYGGEANRPSRPRRELGSRPHRPGQADRPRHRDVLHGTGGSASALAEAL